MASRGVAYPRARDVRLRHRGRWLGGLRAGQPAERRSGDPRARARGRPAGPALGSVRPDAGRARVPDRQSALRLAVSLRAGAVPRRAAHPARAGEAPRWLEQHQRDDLPARESARLRALGGGSRARPLGLRPLSALLQADGRLPGGSRRLPRHRWADPPRARPGDRSALRCVLRGGPAGGLRADRRRERLSPGRLRSVRPHDPSRAPDERHPLVSQPCAAPIEPGGALRRLRDAGGLRAQARGGRRGDRTRPGHARSGGTR